MLAGCTGASLPDWGSSGIQTDWNGPDENVSIESNFGDDSAMTDLIPIGCNETGSLPTSNDLNSGEWVNAMPISLIGWVSAVHHYENGAGQSEESISKAVSTAVVIEAMSYSAAEANYDSGVLGTRVQVKDWGDPNDSGMERPYEPSTAGKPKLQRGEGNTEFHAAGLIPASEEVLEGMEAIEWHVPVKITGYMLHQPGGDNPYDYYYTRSDKPVTMTNNECHILRTDTDGFRANMLVVTIETPNDRITLSEGYSSSVGGINTWVFTILVLALGGGGSFGLFLLSTIMQRKGASGAAKVLLGAAGFESAKTVQQEAKMAKKEGFESATPSISLKQDKPSKAKEAKVEEVQIKGFNLDSILSSASSSSAPPPEASGGGVQVTQEADEIEQKMATGEFDVGGDDYSDESPRSFNIGSDDSDGGRPRGGGSSGGFVGSARSLDDSSGDDSPRHFSATQAKVSEGSAPSRKTRKTRKAKSRAPSNDADMGVENESKSGPPPKKKRGPPPKKGGKSGGSKPSKDDGDFSDFSF